MRLVAAVAVLLLGLASAFAASYAPIVNTIFWAGCTGISIFTGGTGACSTGTTGQTLTWGASGPAWTAPLPDQSLNLFVNPQWQVLSNLEVLISAVQPNTTSTFSPITITGTSTGSAYIAWTYSGSPNIAVNDLVSCYGGTVNAAVSNKPMRVLALGTGTFTTVGWLANYVPGVSMTGTCQQVTWGDLGTAGSPHAAQYWEKSTTLQVWPTERSTEIDPGATRCLGVYKGGVTAVQQIAQPLSRALVTALRGQTVTISGRVQQFVKGGSGTSYAYALIDGVQTSGTVAAGAGGYEDVRLTVAIPTTASTVYIGFAFSGAASDGYHLCKPQLSQASALPSNYFSEVPNDFLKSQEDIVPFSLNGASVTFPSTTDFTGAYYSLYHDPYAETEGRVHWTVTCIQSNTEFKSTTVGAAVAWRNVLGAATGRDIVYGVAGITQVSGVMYTASNQIPTDRGNQTNSIAPGFTILYTATPGLSVTFLSQDVQGYCLN